MNKKRSVLLVKIESSYGVDPTPGGTDAVLVENLTPSNEGLRMVERPAVRVNLEPLQSVYGGRLESRSFDVEVKGSGTAGTPPEIDELLRSCAMAVTNVPATSDTYKPASSSHESCTIYDYLDGKRTILTGCRGNLTGAGEAGGVFKFSFTMTGHVAAETDIALASPTYDSTVPVALVSVPFSIGAYSAIINALNFDMGNTVSMPPDISASDGYGEIQIVSRGITGSFDPENVLIATNDFKDDFISGTNLVLDTGVIGGTAGNKVQITLPAVYYNDFSDGDRDGISTLEMPFAALESSGDDDISIIFT